MDQKENCHHDHNSLNLKGNGNLFPASPYKCVSFLARILLLTTVINISIFCSVNTYENARREKHTFVLRETGFFRHNERAIEGSH